MAHVKTLIKALLRYFDIAITRHSTLEGLRRNAGAATGAEPSQIAANSLVLKTIKGRDVFVRTGTPDETVAASCFGDEFKVIRHLLKDVNRKLLIIDLGGYIGTAAMEFASIPNATVVTLEPSPENYRVLKLNTSKYKNIIPLQAAIGAETRTAGIYARHTGEWGHTLVEAPKDCQSPKLLSQVDVVTVDYLLDRYADDDTVIAALKIDIEGGEVELLENAPWISRFPIVTAELHDRIIDGCSSSWQKAVAALPNRISIFDSSEKRISVDADLLRALP